MPSNKILEAKKQVVEELAAKMQSAAAGVLVKYEGITVAEDTELRAALRKAGVEYTVMKNTLTGRACEIAGYGEEDVKAKFGALYTAFSYGAPPHAGMAPGVDRMIMLIAEEETIRDVIAFPLNGNAQDVMMGAPGTVTEQQLREVHIKVRD